MKTLKLSDLYKGNLYHICTNGFDCPIIMLDHEDFRVDKNYIAIAAWIIGVDALVYCIMSNHVHILIGCKDRRCAERFIRRFKQLYSTHLNVKYGKRKQLRGLEESITLIDDLDYLRKCIAYILRNPLCAKICHRIEDYAWSSYGCYFSKTSDIETGELVWKLTEREKRRILKTWSDLSKCTFRIDEFGMITDHSFVNHKLVEKIFMNSGKTFISHLGHCNDAQMEYDMSINHLIRTNDQEIMTVANNLAMRKFNQNIATLNKSQKCSMLKNLYFNNKTSIPQLSRILGVEKKLIQELLLNT